MNATLNASTLRLCKSASFDGPTRAELKKQKEDGSPVMLVISSYFRSFYGWSRSTGWFVDTGWSGDPVSAFNLAAIRKEFGE